MYSRTILYHNSQSIRQIKRYYGFFTPFFVHKKNTVDEYESYSLKTSQDTKSHILPPVRTKMLVRDFIDDSLYNPHYGFFSKKPAWVTSSKEYKKDEDYVDSMSSFARTHGAAHPHYGHSHTELFQPWFGRAVAKYMVTEYKLTLYPHRDLVIYEMNGGNGRLMPYILDYIRQYEPSVYQRTQYNLIEPTFMSTAHEPLPQHDCPIARFDQSIFDWNRVVTEQCFVLGLEVMTRLGHDMIQSRDNTQYQGLVCIDSQGHHHQLFEPVGNDPLINRYLTFRKKLKTPSSDRAWRQFRLSLANSYEFIPTRLFQLLDILRTYFPGHRLILTDYSHLPHTIEGINAPMVQTCYKDRMVRCKTFRLPPGWYDIMFPINFELVKEMYLLMSHKNVKLLSYEDFVERYERTKKRSSNVKILLT